MYRKLISIITVIALIFVMAPAYSYADDHPNFEIYADGVKCNIEFTSDTKVNVSVPSGTSTISIVRGEEGFPGFIAEMDSYSGISSDDAEDSFDMWGYTKWDNASYNKDNKTFNVPYSLIKGKKPGLWSLDGSSEIIMETNEIAPAHSHTYGEPTYTWSDDNSTCTATAECTAEDCDNSEGKTVTETVNTTNEVTKEATCAAEGECTYTAKFENELFTEQTKTEAVAKIEHTWNEGEVTKEPSVDEEGVMTFTCTVCGETKTEAIPKLTAAEYASSLISDLPSTITVENKDQVKEARDAYEALSEEEKAAFDEAGLLKLEAAEAKLEAAEAKAEAEQAVKDKEAADKEAQQAKDNEKDALDAKAKAEKAQADAEQAKKDAEAAKEKAEKAQKDAEDAAKNAADASTADKTAKEAADTAAKEAQAAADDAKAQLDEAIKAKEAAEAKAEKAQLAQKKAEAKLYKVKGLKVTVKNQKFTVKYKKNAKASGYQIQYKLKTAKKYTNLKKATTKLKVTSKKLKKGKVYQFRVRTYTVVNGKPYYGQWTKVKSVKCK